MSELVAITKSPEERIAQLEADVAEMKAFLSKDRESHEYLGDAYYDEALHGLIRAIVRDGYATMDSLRNDPNMVKFLTTDDWLKTYFRQQFTEDRREPNFVCDDPDYKLVSFSVAAKYDVFVVTFKAWVACAINTVLTRYLSSERGMVPRRRNVLRRSLCGSFDLKVSERNYVEPGVAHERFHKSCDARGFLAPLMVDPAPFVAKFRRVRSGPRSGGRPKKGDA